MIDQTKTVSLVMATTTVYEHKPAIPLRVFVDRTEAEQWRDTLIDYHLSRPEIPFSSDDKGEWQDYEAQLAEWREGHPAGATASHYRQFSIYEIPQGL
tara:strand:- start:67 stop:360 length:294 start_codon:yes stop_codon:yes gene_type:complete